jgi:hypothetical protein
MTETTTKRAKGTYCECCDANRGQPHHDPDHAQAIAIIRRTPVRDRFECQFCREGLGQSHRVSRYTIDPAAFTDGQWEELYNASTIMPRSYEARHTAKPFKRPRKYIELAIEAVTNRAGEIKDLHDDEEWASDLEQAAETLRDLIGPRRLTKKDARKRLRDLLYSDIYTDAPEYADRVEEIHDLIPLVL